MHLSLHGWPGFTCQHIDNKSYHNLTRPRKCSYRFATLLYTHSERGSASGGIFSAHKVAPPVSRSSRLLRWRPLVRKPISTPPLKCHRDKPRDPSLSGCQGALGRNLSPIIAVLGIKRAATIRYVYSSNRMEFGMGTGEVRGSGGNKDCRGLPGEEHWECLYM